MRRLLPILGLFLLAAPAFAANPTLGGVAPRGVQRGTEAVLLLNGGNLADAQEALFYSPGIAVTKLEVVAPNQVKVTANVAADCRLGEHAVRVRAASGLSEIRTFYVGSLPAVEEKEPNSEFTTPQSVPLGCTVHGVVQNEDVDYFVVACKKGQRLSAEVEGMRLGTTLFDPYVAIMDAKRFELAACDDAPLLNQDAAVSVVIPEDGNYIVQVRESAYGGNGGCQYRCHIGTFPRPMAVVPAGGKCGEEVELRFLGDPAGELRQKVKLPATPEANFAVYAQDAGGVSPSGIPFKLVDFGNVVEADGNINADTATRGGELPLAFNGVVSKAAEVDHFRFPGKKGQVFDVQCYARRIGSPLDPVMTLSLVGGGQIAANDDTGGPDSYFRVTLPQDGEYVLTVFDHLRKGGPTHFYRVEFSPIQPRFDFTIPKVAQYSQERQHVAVPRGNRYAALMQVGRVDNGAEFTLGLKGLPAGMAAKAEPFTTANNVYPVVFEAAADAPLGGSLVEVTGVPTDPKQVIGSRFSLSTDFIVGNPGQSIYWAYRPDRLAAAVTEAAPFKLTLVEPKVPLVQNGSMNLKVVVERAEGFKAPITIQMLYNPPGTSSSTSVTIPEGATEGAIFVNAAGNAPVRKWPITVTGVSTVVNGPVWVSTQMATLEVAPPYFAFAIERAAVEQGQATTMFAKITPTTPFEGPAKVKLVGLPAKVTTADLDMTKDTKELAFPLTVDKTAPAGTHRNLFCQVTVIQNGEPIVHNVGTSELRIDVPLPPKPTDTPKPPPMVVAQPVPMPMPMPGTPPPKRLTRLEQLRLEQEAREKAMKEGGTPAPATPAPAATPATPATPK